MRLHFELCETSEQRKLFRETVDQFHSYMKYKDTCNRRINWNVYDEENGYLVAAVGVNSALLALGCRDSAIGWTAAQRLVALNRVANNYRFALRVRRPGLGSCLLGRLAVVAPPAWKSRYGDELVLLETLVKPPWTGTVYRAAGWQQVGMTKGFSFSKAPIKLWQQEQSSRGELARRDPKAAVEKYAVGGKHYDITKSEPKSVWLRPLKSDWKEILCAGSLIDKTAVFQAADGGANPTPALQ